MDSDADEPPSQAETDGLDSVDESDQADETDGTDETAEAGETAEADETVQVWLVERTYSDDEQNIIILVYATPDGERYFRKERALTSFTNDVRETTAAVDVSPNNLGAVTDPEERERYATEAARMAEAYDPDDTV